MSIELHVIGRIKEHEGGLNEKEPPHVGGVSFRGITQQAFDEWINGEGAGKNKGITSVRELVNHPEIVDAFYHDFLKNAWHLPECLQYMYCDFYTNARSKATKIIQEMVGIDADGIWGSGTTRTVQAWRADIEAKLEADPNLDNDLIMQFHDAKIAHYEWLAAENPTMHGPNLPGWKKRAMRLLTELSPYFEDDEPVAKAIDITEVPPPVESDTDQSTDASILYHDTEIPMAELSQWLSAEAQLGYVLSCVTPSTNEKKVIAITELNTKKAAKMLADTPLDN